MKINFRTNLDKYDNDWFPKYLEAVPRKGDLVSVKQDIIQHLKNQKLPSSLEVVRVIWFSDYTDIELWYSEIDIKIGQACGFQLF